MRTITKILEGLENDDTVKEIDDRWKEINRNLKKYPLVEIYQAKEKLRQAAKALAKKHGEIIKKIISND